MPCESHHPWLYHSNYIWRRVQVMKLRITNNDLLIKFNFRPLCYTDSDVVTNTDSECSTYRNGRSRCFCTWRRNVRWEIVWWRMKRVGEHRWQGWPSLEHLHNSCLRKSNYEMYACVTDRSTYCLRSLLFNCLENRNTCGNVNFSFIWFV
jgi:hypothetical protein